MWSRWATEDPNPTEKRAEEKRITDEGQKAIAGMLDENLVEAAQTLRALEEGDEQDFYPIEAPNSDPQVSSQRQIESTRPAKRIRKGTSSDDRPSEAEVVNGKGDVAARPVAVAEGMFSADTMDNLRFYAEMTKQQKEEDRLKERKIPPKPAMASLLGAYGSDEDSD